MPDHRDRDQAEEVGRPSSNTLQSQEPVGQSLQCVLARPGRSPRLRSLDPPRIASRRSRPAAVADRGALPPDGAAYPQILRGESYVWWRSVAGVVFGISLFCLVTMVVSQALVMVFWATTAGEPAVPGLLCQGLRIRDAARHAGGEPRPGHVDPDRVGSDGDGPSDAAEMALLGPAADPLALPVRVSGDRRGRVERRDAAFHHGWRNPVLPPSEGFLGLPGGDRAHLAHPGGRRRDLLSRLPAPGSRQSGSAGVVRRRRLLAGVCPAAWHTEPAAVRRPACLRPAGRAPRCGAPAAWKPASRRT